ncbi:unnamed protein product [Pleuronectes platessa]|uniref:Uncharacterized protein n=1 Tax=Pleuronectes platessa TaxID=8262 RepID=A0A9N7VZM3_PLEPL|nr:unnamed protein product [Pleuronectes platessa]
MSVSLVLLAVMMTNKRLTSSSSSSSSSSLSLLRKKHNGDEGSLIITSSFSSSLFIPQVTQPKNDIIPVSTNTCSDRPRPLHQEATAPSHRHPDSLKGPVSVRAAGRQDKRSTKQQ